jgi:hypothetical protein
MPECKRPSLPALPRILQDRVRLEELLQWLSLRPPNSFYLDQYKHGRDHEAGDHGDRKASTDARVRRRA